MRNKIIAVIRLYQRFISPFLGNHCRFYPSCSEYSCLALKKYGLIKGFCLSCWRVLRCNPFSRGGVDFPQ